jgi:fluoroacetyl-CoA thioesterase
MSLSDRVGSTFSRSVTVDAGRSIDFMGPELRVYATPSLLGDLEWICRDWLLHEIGEGDDSVGVGVELEHTRATPLGMAVTFEVTLAAVEGRSATFDIVVRDAVEEVGRARHRRMVVEKERLKAAVQKKRARLR